MVVGPLAETMSYVGLRALVVEGRGATGEVLTD
jgi:hypothetical protein